MIDGNRIPRGEGSAHTPDNNASLRYDKQALARRGIDSVRIFPLPLMSIFRCISVTWNGVRMRNATRAVDGHYGPYILRTAVQYSIL